MDDYYSEFVELSLQQCTKNSYIEKEKVKKHNIATKKLHQLQMEMRQNVSEDTLLELLHHKDDRVKINATNFCLQSKILIEQSILTLEKIIAVSNDSTICFSAKMLLEKYTKNHI